MSRLSEMQNQFREKLRLEGMSKMNARKAIPVRVGIPVPTRIIGSSQPKFHSSSPATRNQIPTVTTENGSTRLSPTSPSITSLQKNSQNENGNRKQFHNGLSISISRRTSLPSPVTIKAQVKQRLSLESATIKIQPSNGCSINEKVTNAVSTNGKTTIGREVNVSRAMTRKGSSSSLLARKQQYPCKVCGRSFSLQDRLSRHEEICEKSQIKRRKQFDSTAQRFKGLPKEYVQTFHSKSTPEDRPSTKTSNWKEQHQHFIATIRAKRSNGEIRLQTSAELQCDQQCKFCSRRFNEEAIKRHEAICEKVFKISDEVAEK